MLQKINLRKLAEMQAPERVFLSIYLSSPKSLPEMEKRLETIKKMVMENSVEYQSLVENKKLVEDYFDNNNFRSGGICIFCCWLLDYFKVYPLQVPIDDLIYLDSSPYIRPLATLQDEYENFAVVAADNEVTRIYLVSSATAEAEEKIKGNIKNHVKVGGWSQQRYERRRSKEFQHYTKEVTEHLTKLEKQKKFHRLILVGSKETILEIKKSLPKILIDKLIGEKSMDLKKEKHIIDREIFDLFLLEERKAERELWATIKNRFFRGEHAVVGIEEVLAAAREGRIEKVIVNRDYIQEGVRCRKCENLFAHEQNTCPSCGSNSVFKVDLVNEIVELLSITSADIDFADEIVELKEAGGIAALLRY